MTRIWLMSDLHLETSNFDLPATPAGAEVLVIAGDVSEHWSWSLNHLVGWRHRTGLPAVFVPGNHDYYGVDVDIFEYQNQAPGRFAKYGIHVLHSGQSVTIAGSRFVGATLWTDFKLSNNVPAAFAWFKASMPDHMSIRRGERRVLGRDLKDVHKRHLALIEAVLAVPFDGPSVVVTHHAPHPNSLAVPEIIDHADASFASDLTSTIEGFRPELWLHGHVHSTLDYRVGTTRIVANARGYAVPTTRGRHIENREFNEGLVIDV